MTNSNAIKIESGGYILSGTINEEGIGITGYEGGGSRLYIPDSFDGVAITNIERKAFLANKGLREASLPGSITSIGEWAFAKCENLRNIILRGNGDGKANLFGNKVFESCQRIENICMGYEDTDAQSHLLGAVIYRMPAEYLLKDSDIGQPAWYTKWDLCLSTYLNEPDIDGYTDLVLCGEEDIFYNEPDFAMNKRRKKSSLCLLRLMNDDYISGEMREKYVNYLNEHTKGCETQESWDVLLEEYGEQTDYYKLFAEIGCINVNNIDEMIEDMGSSYAEAKAYMLDLKRERFSSDNIFDIFEL